MTKKELDEVLEQLQRDGHSDEDIAASFYLMFSEKKINLEQFIALLAAIGYEVDDEFLQMSDDEKRTFALNNNKTSKEDVITFTFEQASECVEELLKEGKDEEDIAESLYIMYEDKNIDVITFMKLMDKLDFELEDEFFDELSECERKKALEYKKKSE